VTNCLLVVAILLVKMALDESWQKVLTDHKRKRGVIKASLTRIVNFVNRFDPREQAISLLAGFSINQYIYIYILRTI